MSAEGLLKGHPLVREDQRPDVIEDLVWPALAHSLEVLNLLVVDLLAEPQLDHASVEGVQVVQDGVDLEVAEVLPLACDHLFEVLGEALPRAEGCVRFALHVAGLEEASIETSASDVVGEPLDTLVGPPLHALHELPLVLVVELLDAFLEFDLRRPQGLELLQVEERLGDRELVATA